MRLYGRNPVLERIRSDPGSIKKIYLRQRTDLSDIVKEAEKQGLRFSSVDKPGFLRLCGDVNAQGVMAEVEEYRYTPFPEMLERAHKQGTVPVFLDGVTDPQNLGSIIRTLACLGGFSLVVPEHRSAGVNETVLRVACGGENHISISRITNSVRGITTAREKGFWTAGAAAEKGEDILASGLKYPLAVVIGSEDKGIRPGIMKHLDAVLSLPMRGARLSYNVAVAASLFCYEINRRKRTDNIGGDQ